MIAAVGERSGAGRFAFALAVLLGAGALPAADAGDLHDAAGDEVHAATVVPDPSRKVGEVRLVTRGEAAVVQTLLSTKLLERVIDEIRQKEEGNWPAGDPSTTAYLAALESARRTVERRDPVPDWSDRRRRLLIEFAADATDAKVFVGTFRFSRDGSDTSVHDREVFETLALPRAYVLRNMRLILADSFKVPEPDVDRLGPLGPAASAGADPPGAATPVPKGAATSAPKGAATSAPKGAAN